MQVGGRSLTDVMTFVSGAALAICMLSQTFFYWRLDAIWVMSLLSPSIYLIELFKVFFTIICVIFSGIIVSEIYKKLLSKYWFKEKLDLDIHLRDYLLGKKIVYKWLFYVFSVLILVLTLFVSKSYIILSNLEQIYIYLIFGVVISLLGDHEFDSLARRIVTVGLCILVVCFNVEGKINNLPHSPVVYLKDQKSEFHKANLLEVARDKVVLFKINDKQQLEIKVEKMEFVEKIVANTVETS